VLTVVSDVISIQWGCAGAVFREPATLMLRHLCDLSARAAAFGFSSEPGWDLSAGAAALSLAASVCSFAVQKKKDGLASWSAFDSGGIGGPTAESSTGFCNPSTRSASENLDGVSPASSRHTVVFHSCRAIACCGCYVLCRWD